jgi:hypothetical protein
MEPQKLQGQGSLPTSSTSNAFPNIKSMIGRFPTCKSCISWANIMEFIVNVRWKLADAVNTIKGNKACRCCLSIITIGAVNPSQKHRFPFLRPRCGCTDSTVRQIPSNFNFIVCAPLHWSDGVMDVLDWFDPTPSIQQFTVYGIKEKMNDTHSFLSLLTLPSCISFIDSCLHHGSS